VREVLVTGANGFVGSHICEILVNDGFNVRALVRTTSNLANLKGIDVTLAYADLNDAKSLEKAVDGTEFVINNAGLTRALDFDQFHKVNAAGTLNILNAIMKVNPGLCRFVQISSTAACGPAPSQIPISEHYPPHPLTAYGRSKLEGEKAALSFKDRCPVTILRPCAVYGPKDKDMLPFFKAVKLGFKPSFGSGESYINFTYVKDLARVVVKAISAETPSGGIYFVAEKRSYSYSQAGAIIAEVMGKKAINVHVPIAVLSIVGKMSQEIARWRGKAHILTAEKALEVMQKFWLFDTSRVERDMGLGFWTDFRTGVAETVAWYKKEGWL
jgi:nucleoside-diphosphate-sugar epimerase